MLPSARSLWALTLLALTGCSVQHHDGYLRRAGRNMGDAMTRAADTLGVGGGPETMYARANVNVRSGPDVSYHRIGAVAAGRPVPVIQEKNGWYWIRYGSGHGWVNANYVVAGASRKTTAAARRDSAPRPTAEAAPQSAHAGAQVRAKKVETLLGEKSAALSTTAPTTSAPQYTPAFDSVGDGAVSSASESRIDRTDSAAEADPASLPGDAAASATPVLSNRERLALEHASAAGATVDVAGITFRWGMSPIAAAARYGDRAQRVETNGAVWLRATSVGSGVSVPVEWFDPHYCSARLCGIHHVINDVKGDHRIADEIAQDFVGQYGRPTADFWTDFGYGRLRMRTWRTPSARIRLSHQEAQTYVAIDYEPVGPSKPPSRGTGAVAREEAR